jgi:hypothetical protein
MTVAYNTPAMDARIKVMSKNSQWDETDQNPEKGRQKDRQHQVEKKWGMQLQRHKRGHIRPDAIERRMGD